MMGSKKRNAMRDELRAGYKKSDAELLAQFNRQIAAAAKEPNANATKIDTLRLLRDALVEPQNGTMPTSKVRRVATAKGRCSKRLKKPGRAIGK